MRTTTLWDLTRGQRLRYGGAIAALGLAQVAFLTVPPLLGRAIDAIESGTATAPLLWGLAGAIVAFSTIGGLLHYVRARWAAMASETVVQGVRDRLYGHLETLPCAYHDHTDTGDLIQRCTSDVETVRVFVSGQIVEIARTLLLTLFLVPVLFWIDASMALVTLALVPVIFVFALLFFRRVKRAFLKMEKAEGEMTTVLQENLTGIRVVRAFARQEHECAKFGEKNRAYRDLFQRFIRMLGTYWAVSDVLCMGQIALVLFYGAAAVQRGDLTAGTLVTFLFYVNLLLWPVRHLGRVLTDSGSAIVALGRLKEILAVADETALEGEGDPDALEGAIEVEGLTFGFEPEKPVLRNLSVRLAPGETLALLGPPGSGKSTLIQLLLRLYDYEEGSIRLDGRELRDLGRRFVRSQVGVVLQEPFLYSKTIGQNVRIGRGGASRREIEHAAATACIHMAIQSFDRGYDTLVGERGVTLSGGQRQRVALARALLKDPPILVLDDALSAVDTDTEAQILKALRERRGVRTTIVIAHRLSSTIHADRILVLERGAVVQAGTHEELLAEEGRYRELWRIQGALEEEISA